MAHQSEISSADDIDMEVAESSVIQIHEIANVESGGEEQIRPHLPSRYHGNTDSGEESPYESRRSDRIPFRTHSVEDHGSHYVIKERETNEDQNSAVVHVIGECGSQEVEYSTLTGESGGESIAVVYENQLGENVELLATDNQVFREHLMDDNIVEHGQASAGQIVLEQNEQGNTYTMSGMSGEDCVVVPPIVNTAEASSHSPKMPSNLLERLPMLGILDESGKISTLSDLPPGSQIILDQSYKGLADLPSGSRIILNTNAHDAGQVPHVVQEISNQELEVMALQNNQKVEKSFQEEMGATESQASSGVAFEQVAPHVEIGTISGHPVECSDQIQEISRFSAPSLQPADRRTDQTFLESPVPVQPGIAYHQNSEPIEPSEPNDHKTWVKLDSNLSDLEHQHSEEMPTLEKEGRDSKHDWKWFRDSTGRKPSKFTCKVYDAVFATISIDLLHSLQSAMSLGDFPDNCALLEHLLVKKHHVTDLMIREDDTELQLAGDLIDIMEVHNVLLGNVDDKEKCVHKALQPCSAVVKDIGIMCNGVPQTTGRSGRKQKRIYTKDMYTLVPFGDHPSDPERLAPSDQEGHSGSSDRVSRSKGRSKELIGDRKSGRISKPPVKMEDSVSPPKKKRGRKPYRRTKVNTDIIRDSEVESFREKEQDLEAVNLNSDVTIMVSMSAAKTPVVSIASEQEERAQQSSMQERNVQTEDEVETMDTGASEDVNLVYLEVQASSEAPEENILQAENSTAAPCIPELDPIIEQPEILDILDAIKGERRNTLSLDDVPMTTQTVDSFLPIITSHDAQSEDENLLASHDDTLESAGESTQPPPSTSQMAAPMQEPVRVPRPNYQRKRKKKDYEALTPFKYFCTMCSFKTKRESHYHKHLLLHTEKNLPVLRCSHCDYSTLTLSRLRHHEVSHTTNALTCVVCTYKTMSLQQLRKHHLKNHEIRSANLTMSTEMKCDHCTYKTDKMHLFQRHQQCHSHVSGNKSGVQGMMIPTYSCAHCSYGTRMKESFIRHMENAHSNERPYLCDICGSGFKRKDTLKTHRQIHLDKGQRMFKYFCPHCNKGLRSKGHLDEHVSMHSSKRQYLCEICGASFKTRGIQRRHVFTIHKNPKAYPCDTCKKNFNTKFALHRHNRTHEVAQLSEKTSNLTPAELNIAETTSDVSISQVYMDVKQDDQTVALTAENLNNANIIHIQPMQFADQALGTDQVITELQVLPVDSQLEGATISSGSPQEVAQIVQGLDPDQQKVELQLQPTLVQTSTGATTLFYLTTVPQDVT